MIMMIFTSSSRGSSWIWQEEKQVCEANSFRVEVLEVVVFFKFTVVPVMQKCAVGLE